MRPADPTATPAGWFAAVAIEAPPAEDLAAPVAAQAQARRRAEEEELLLLDVL